MDRINDISTLDKATAYVILRMGRLLRFDLSQTLQEAGAEVTPEQWFLLFRLYEQTGLSQSDLADKVLNDHPNITRMIDTLEAKAIIRRDNDPGDRRRYQLHLTEAGRTLVKGLLPVVIEARRRVFQGIEANEIEQLHSTLEKIEKNLFRE